MSSLVKKLKDMPYNRRQGLIILGLIIVLISIPVTISLIRQNPQFISKAASSATDPITFDGAPTTPQPFATHPDFANFDVQMGDNDLPETWYSEGPYEAQHGPNCEAPPATHTVTNYSDFLYICNNHLMTSFYAGTGYGVASITPNRILDWTNGPATVDFEMSTKIMADRDWVDIIIASFTDNVATPFEATGAFDNFPPMGFWFKLLGGFNAARVFNRVPQQLADCNCQAFGTGITPGTNEAAVRQHFRITISRTHLRMERLPSATATSWVFFDGDIPDTLTTQGMTTGVVQFTQHDYDTPKGNERGPNNELLGPGLPTTWHWDTFQLQPSQFFTLIKSSQRIVPASPGGPGTYDVHFNAAAPANAYMRFSGDAGLVELSYDNGATFHNARMTSDPNVAPHVWRSYMDPVPANVQDVKVRLSQELAGGVAARDFAFWSTTASAPPTCTKVGDINCDGLVNILDMSILLSKWNTSDTASDLNHDGKVNILDLSILLSKWGS